MHSQYSKSMHYKVSGGYYEKVTPVPIPNTAVKLLSAENTWMVTSRENRSPPDFLYSSIAQLVEHAAVNRRVVGSSPTWGAKQKHRTSLFCVFV